jgi:signal peptidase II
MLILAGAFGNFIDRMFYGVLYGEGPLFYGLVVDFIQIDIPDIQLGQFAYTHWPVFNIADSCVSIGMILILSYNRYLPYPFTQVNEVTETTHNGN